MGFMIQKRTTDWNAYASKRNLSRNHLLYAHHLELVDDFLMLFGQISQEKKVLDVGPANGFFMVLLRELGFVNLEGLEISDIFLSVLRSKNFTVHPGDITTGDGLEKLVPPYDIVLMMEVLEHLEEPEQALCNVRELLAKDGFLYLTVPICACVFSRLLRIKLGIAREEQVRRIDETHIHAFLPKDLIDLLVQTGFEVLQVRRVSFGLPILIRNHFARRVVLLLRALLPNSLRGACLSVVAKPLRQERK